MIITLKGADFSNSNIGNLYHWSINYTIGRGVTHNGTTTVLKGEEFTATFTLAEGYELAGSVTVIMGNTILTNAITIVENVIAIDIPSVTGTVYINIPTQTSAINLLNLDKMSSALRYSPGAYNIVGSNGTKYGLYTVLLKPSTTYELKINSGYTGGLFSTEPVKNAKTTVEYNLNGSGAATHTITTTDTHYWLALNIATIDVSDENTPLTPNAAWESAALYEKQ